MTITELRKELRKLNTRYELNDDYKSEDFINESEGLIKLFLKEIRNELYNKATPFEDSSGYIYSKTLFMSEVDEVCNKYLN